MAEAVLKPPKLTGGRQVRPAALDRVTALIYGLSGSGKTFLLRGLVESSLLYPALILSCDEGHASLVDLVDDEKMLLFSTPRVEDIEKLVDSLLTQTPYFRTIAIDNISILHLNALYKAAEDRVARSGRGTSVVFEQADYGIARTSILTMISGLLYQPALANVNIIVTAQAASIVDDATGVRTVDINHPGKVAVELPGYFDIVGYLYNESPSATEIRAAKANNQPPPESRRILQMSQTSTVLVGRNRGNKLGESVTNPNLGKLLPFYRKSFAAPAAKPGQAVSNKTPVK